MKQINDTTFVSDNLGDLKPLVTIGGKPVDKFIPNLNMSFHNDEFFINLNRRDKQAISITDKAEIDGIDKDIFYIDENGRFKWDIEFKERPLKNSWTWELKHAEGIEFYFQGELTDEEIKDGCDRPLEVVGSYAVYCNKANNKYKTGKLCHIYRPFCYDAKGNTIYADLLIADGQLTITIDAKWLDSAAYPVRLDPTIGYMSVGASRDNTSAQVLNASKVYGIPVNSGVLSKIKFYCIKVSGEPEFVSALYNNTESNLPGPLVSISSGTTISNVLSWSEVSINGNILSGNQYWLCHATFVSGTSLSYVYDTASAELRVKSSISYTDPFPLSPKSYNQRISIYLEYTESGGSSLPAIINNYRQQGVM